LKKTIISFIFILFTINPAFPEKEWKVYFTNPSRIKKSTVTNPRDGLIEIIKNSKKSFYGAFYDISSMPVADEMIAAYLRGVDVKLVTDNDTFSGAAISKILESGIPVIPDTGPGLMHNKFAVIDGSTVFTGSYNTTDNCTWKNNNNALIIKSQELADIYNSEFDEMFYSGVFGNRIEDGAFRQLQKKYHVKLNDLNINVYFAPEDNVEKIIHDRINNAKKSIRFMQFSFTSDVIGEVIIKKFKEGLDVQGVFEKKGSNTEYSEYVKMIVESVPVRLDKNRDTMHHKVIIIDDYRVITGSFNISKNANLRNDENIIILDSAELASKYIEEFNRIYNEAK
jgi:phosphatidylserine/phosphatidylglycerophosphate/cardiolipin synthase-like enzyme